jgi:hypothetical protein
MDKSNLVKIAFDVSAGGDFSVERLWAIPTDDGVYIIDNSPFHVYGISYGDRVFARNQNGELCSTRVAGRGGHSTYRVRLPLRMDHSYFKKYWKPLEELGCSYEGASGSNKIYSIDIPILDKVPEVYRILQDLEDRNVWTFEEAHYAKAADEQ